jgi:peptide/nickel transport system substrate-binding protein
MKVMKKVITAKLLVIFVIMCVLLSVNACGTQESSEPTPTQETEESKPGETNSEQSKYGGVLRTIETVEGSMPIGVPWEARGADTVLMKPVLENLIREDVDGTLHPWLATGWEVSEDKKAITFFIREGVKFHDGTDLNAEAVKWNLDKQIESSSLGMAESVEVIDDYTVRINLKDKFMNTVIVLLANVPGSIVSPTAVEKNGIEWARTNPVGTGAFMIDTFKRGESVSFKKWDGYWQEGLPYLDGVEHLLVRDFNTARAALLTEGAEQVHVAAVTQGEEAKTMKDLGFDILGYSAGPQALFPDSANPESPLANLKVREAISYAIDREAIVRAKGFGFWEPAYQWASPGEDCYIEDYEGQKYDPEKAKQLLKEAGYENGFEISLYALNTADKDVLVSIQNFLADVGIKAEIDARDSGGFNELIWGGWKNGLLFQVNGTMPNFNSVLRFSFRV